MSGEAGRSPRAHGADMAAAIASLSRQAREGWRLARDLDLASAGRGPRAEGPPPRALVVAGVGGSAIGAEMLAGLTAARGSVPVVVVRGYRLPGWVDNETLVVASSFSGGTEETLSAFREAARRGASRIALTSGGALADEAAAAGVPVLRVPPGGQPRAAVGYALFALLGLAARCGVLSFDDADAAAGADALDAAVRRYGAAPRLRGGRLPADGAADRLAAAWHDRMPVIFGGEHLLAVARRWAGQVSENAKCWAFWLELPEADHNTLAGFGSFSQTLACVLLDGASLHPRMRLRVRLTAEALRDHGIPVEVVSASAPGALAELCDLLVLGDCASLRLSERRGVDPTPVPALEAFKARLAATHPPGSEGELDGA